MSWFLIGLRHEFFRLAKKNKRLQVSELLILNDVNADDELTEMLDRVAAPDDIQAEVEDKIFLQEALALLTLQQQTVITATILEERTEQEVADELGMSQPAVHQMKERALKRLRKHYFLAS